MVGRFAVLAQRGPFSRSLLSYGLAGITKARPGSWYLVPFHHDITPALLVDTEPDTDVPGTLLPALAGLDAPGIFADVGTGIAGVLQSLERNFMPWEDALAIMRFLSGRQRHDRQWARLAMPDPAAFLGNIQAVAGMDDVFAQKTKSLRLLLIDECTPGGLPRSLWRIPTRDRGHLYEQGVIVDARCATFPSAHFVPSQECASPEFFVGPFEERAARTRILAESVVAGNGSVAVITSSEALTTAYERALEGWNVPVCRWPGGQGRKRSATRSPGIWLSTRLFAAALLPEISLVVVDLGIPGEWPFHWERFSLRSMVQLMCEWSATRSAHCLVGASVPTLAVLDACGTTLDALPRTSERTSETAHYETRRADNTAAGPTHPPRILLQQTIRLLRETYDKTFDSLLLLNIRGFATLVECAECGYTATCPVCGTTLTLGAERRHLFCKQCGHSEPAPDVCPNCHGTQLRSRGYGLDRLKRELGRTFPLSSIIPADEAAFDSSRSIPKPGIYLGTYADVQVIPALRPRAVVFPDVSVGLHHPVFDNLEQLFAVVRGAETEAVGGTVVVQLDRRTTALRDVLEKQPLHTFLLHEAEQREELGMPPFSRQFSIRFPVRSGKVDTALWQHQFLDALNAEAVPAQGFRLDVLRTAPDSRVISAEFRVDRAVVALEQRVNTALSHIPHFRNATVRIY